jgi:hypothetical protein
VAQGDLTFFNAAKLKVLQKKIHFSTDTIKFALVTSSVTPIAATADPCWGAGGATNLTTYEVTPGGNYSAGGSTVGSLSLAEDAGTVTWDSAAVSIAQSGSNPTNARWGIYYSDTSANKDAIAFVDLGGVTDLSVGGFSVTPNASGLATLS